MPARLLRSTVVERDPLADGGTTIQERQIESAFYFELDGSYCGGHMRSTPLSDSEAHRKLRELAEGSCVAGAAQPRQP